MKNPIKTLIRQLRQRDPFAVMSVIIGAGVLGIVIWAIFFN